MPQPSLRFPAPYAALHGLAFGRQGHEARAVDSGSPLPVANGPLRAVFHGAIAGFTPAAGATDIAALLQRGFGRTGFLRRVRISGRADAAATVELRLQRSYNGGGLPDFAAVAPADPRDNEPTLGFGSFAANRAANDSGIGVDRPLIASGTLGLGAAGDPGRPLEFAFSGRARPGVRALEEWLVLNWNGQPVPAGCRLDISAEWEEQLQPPLIFAGDSTTSNAAALFTQLKRSPAVASEANLFNAGANGFRLHDYLLHTNGIPYPQGWNGALDRMAGIPGVLVLCYGINDMRQGLVSREELVAMLDAAIHATLNGTVAGTTYNSPVGARTSFTWPATILPNPDARIVLWSPNPLASDGNGNNWIELQGRFAGMTLAHAAQLATDDLREAYAAFEGDPRVFRVVHKQDVFGRTARPLAQSSLLLDNLHPNARGQVLSARQIMPHLLDALAAARSDIV